MTPDGPDPPPPAPKPKRPRPPSPSHSDWEILCAMIGGGQCLDLYEAAGRVTHAVLPATPDRPSARPVARAVALSLVARGWLARHRTRRVGATPVTSYRLSLRGWYAVRRHRPGLTVPRPVARPATPAPPPAAPPYRDRPPRRPGVNWRRPARLQKPDCGVDLGCEARPATLGEGEPMSDATTPVPVEAHRDPLARAVAAALAEPFEAKEVKWKPQMVKNNRCLAMGYIDARLIQDRLDEVVGAENWEDTYKQLPDGSVMCRLRVRFGDRWVTKMDVGSPSEQPDQGDRMKAAVSDALKRAGVKFGIGRYLYRLTGQWVDYDPVKKQIVSPPLLPAFALPKKKPGAAEPPKQLPAKQLPAKADAPKVDAPKADAPKEVCKSLPKDGNELHGRLKEYDRKLAAEKLCPAGALVTHVIQKGVAAGFPEYFQDWTGTAAMQFAVDATKEFEEKVRKTGRAAGKGG